MSSIDFALWDLKAKQAEMPLHRLLGGATTRVPFYIAGGYYEEGKSIDDLQRQCADYVALGAKAVKIKIGGLSISDDITRIAAVREAIGDQIELMVDANCAYTAAQAIRVGRHLEEFDIAWFEEPVDPEDYAGYANIARHLNVPIAAGEQEYGLSGFRDLISRGEISIAQPDARLTGGVSEFMRISTLAEALGLTISSHGDQQLHCSLMASIRNPSYAEYIPPNVDPYIQDFYQKPVEIDQEGYLVCSEDLGCGWQVDAEAMQGYRVGSHQSI